MSFRNIHHHHHAVRRNGMSLVARNRISVMPSRGRGNTARLSSTQEDFSSMKVSDLRELLREKGLPVSGIKAALVERLETASVGKQKGGKKSKRKDVDMAAIDDDDHLYNDFEDELSGLANHLKTGEEGEPSRKEMVGKRVKNVGRMPRNLVFAKEEDEDDDEWDDDNDEDDGFDPNKTAGVPQYKREKRQKEDTTFKEDFQGTRVFVQGLPEDADWKDLKDHFQLAGDVVFASVSVDQRTGRSKQCGIVQFETSSMAQKAIREMRNHPMNGEKLYVRKDVQETRQPSARRSSRPERETIPTVWKRANDQDKDGGGDDWYNLRDEELKEIESLIERRDKQRMQKNYKMSDQLRNELKEEYGVHLDDRLKLWWTDTKHGSVPGMVSEIKGEGRWGKQKPWRQIPTNPDSDAMVDTEYVMGLLEKRDRARRRKDFNTADDLLQKAHDAPQGELGLRIHDESRTWRIWTTERPPPKRGDAPMGYEKLTPEEMCIKMVTENEPDKVEEIEQLLRKFPGREWNIFKKLKERYN